MKSNNPYAIITVQEVEPVMEGRMEMYQAGDKVVYGMHGVCEVVELEKRVVERKTVTYLVLEPVGQQGTRYLVPAHNEAAMKKVRPMLSREDMDVLLSSETVHTDAWIKDEGQRKQLYRDLINSGDRQRLLQMIHTLYSHRDTQTAMGKKVHMCDDNFLRDAEKLLCSELSVILDIPANEAKQYLRRKLKEDA